MNKPQERIAVFAFGVVFVSVMLVLATKYPQPSRFQYTVFRIVLALAAAGIAAMLPGFIDVKVASWVKAGGALGVFAIVCLKPPAELVVDPPPPPATGNVILFDGNKRYDESGFNFSTRQVVPWSGAASGPAAPDILVAKPDGEAKPEFFLSHETGDFKNPTLDKGARAGIRAVEGQQLKDVTECPSDGYTNHWFRPSVNSLYCVITHDGTHYAVVRVDAIDDDRIGFFYAYQKDGTPNF